MEYKKKYDLNGLVISKNDIEKIAKLLISKIEEEKDKLTIEVSFNDKTSITSVNDMRILESDYINEKDIDSIIMVYRDYEYNNRIDVNIITGKYNNSSISIVNNEEEKFMANCKILEERVNNIRKQKFIWKFADTIYFYLISTSIILFIMLMPILYFKLLDSKMIYPVFLLLFYLSSYIAFLIIKKINILYPNIEFEFGNKKIINKNKAINTFKTIAGLIFTGVLLPIIVDYILKIINSN